MDCFYDKEIIIYKKQKKRDENGVDIDQYVLIDTIKCDVQSIGKTSEKEDYGYTTENIKSIYCDYNENVKIGNIVAYNKKTFKIDKIPWGEDGDEDFMHFIAVERKVNLNEP